jgi:putative FmdB family regulatory protein
MPTYDYLCGACEHKFEEFQSITAPSLKKCPVCGKLKLKRLIGTGAGIIFKGSGFYETDYRSENYKKAAKADSEGSSGGAGKGDSKTETKTEAKSEVKAESKSEAKPAKAESAPKKEAKAAKKGE